MLALDLNLASRPFRNNTLLWTGYGSGLVLLLAFSVWNVLTWRDHVRRLDELQTTVGSIESQMADLESREAVARAGIGRFDQKALGIQTFKANEVIEWRVFSWTRLFNVMESIQPANVRMTSIRPLFRAGRRAEELGTMTEPLERAVPVSVEGLAKDFSALMAFQEALFADAHIGRVVPERFQRTDSREIVFSLTFIYRPDVEAPLAAETAAAGNVAQPGGDDGAQPPLAEPTADAGPAPDATPPPAPEEAASAAVEPGPPGGAAETPPPAEAAAAPARELAADAQPEQPPRRPFVKGRKAAKAARGEQP